MNRLADIRLVTKLGSGVSSPYYPWNMADLHARFAGLSLGPGDEILVQRLEEGKEWVTVRRRTTLTPTCAVEAETGEGKGWVTVRRRTNAG